MSKQNERLWGATRQFRHNTDNSPDYENPKMGFVIAYDSAEVDAVVAELEAQIRDMRRELRRIQAIAVAPWADQTILKIANRALYKGSE